MNHGVFRTLTEVSSTDLSGIVRLIRVAIKKHRSGERGEIDLLNPRPEDVNIDDMLRNLSRIPRWCGAGRLSVLQHMMHVAPK